MDSDDEDVEMAMPIELLDERWESYRERCTELLKYVATVLRANNKNSRLRVLSDDRLRVLQYIDEKLARRVEMAEADIDIAQQIEETTCILERPYSEARAAHERRVRLRFIEKKWLTEILLRVVLMPGPVPRAEKARMLGVVSNATVRAIVSYLIGRAERAERAGRAACVACKENKRARVCTQCMYLALCEECGADAEACPRCGARGTLQKMFTSFGKTREHQRREAKSQKSRWRKMVRYLVPLVP
jgi:hypothetical protein